MLRLFLAVAAVAGVAQLTSCSPCGAGKPADAIPDLALVDGGLGAPCGVTNECRAGLICDDTFEDTDGNSEPETFRACTQSCATMACPEGSACADSPAHGPFCVPSCTTDADCQTGQRAGTCAGPATGRIADGGITIICQPIVCWSGSGCPTGYVCQDYTSSSTGACSGGSGGSALTARSQGSWCGKSN